MTIRTELFYGAKFEQITAREDDDDTDDDDDDVADQKKASLRLHLPYHNVVVHHNK